MAPLKFAGDDAVPTCVMLAVCAVTLVEPPQNMLAVKGLNKLWMFRAREGGGVRGLITRILLGAQYTRWAKDRAATERY